LRLELEALVNGSRNGSIEGERRDERDKECENHDGHLDCEMESLQLSAHNRAWYSVDQASVRSLVAGIHVEVGRTRGGALEVHYRDEWKKEHIFAMKITKQRQDGAKRATTRKDK
jgi:hypothetical protein